MEERVQICQDINFERGLGSPEQTEQWLNSHQNCFNIIIAGRSNVGKSSLINVLFKRNIARTSKTPGRTREINVFSFKPNFETEKDISFMLYDLPGHGFAKVSKDMKKDWERLLQTFFMTISPEGTCLLNIQDARHPNTTADLVFTDFITPFNLETFLLYNKIDKLKTQKDRALLNKQKKSIYQTQKSVKQIHFTSSITKQGLPELVLGIKSLMINGSI